MVQIAGLADLREAGPPGDLGGFMFPASAVAFRYTFSGTTRYAVIRVSTRGWVLVGAPSTAPETPINASFTALGAGTRIVLLDATYTLAVLGISLTANNQCLEGQGRGSYVDGNALGGGIYALNINAMTDCEIRNLSARSSSSCVYIANAAHRFKVVNVTVVSGTNSLYITGGSTTEGWIINCWFGTNVTSDGSTQIHVSGCSLVRLILTGTSTYWMFTGNTVIGSGDVGIYIAHTNSSYNIFSNNLIMSHTYSGLRTDANPIYIMLVGNIIYNNGWSGIDARGSFWTISGNTVTSSIKHGIYCEILSLSIIVGNMCNSNDRDNTATYDGINTSQNNQPDNLIVGNYCYGNHRYGIGVSSRTIVLGNFCYQNDRHGIYSSGSDCLINGNYCYRNGVDAAGTYHGIYLAPGQISAVSLIGNFCYDAGNLQEDGIHLGDGVSSCLISGNYCYNGMGSGIALEANNVDCFITGNFCNANDDYGIEITAASCARTRIGDNRLLGNVTGPFLDGGTDTQLPTLILTFIDGTTFLNADAAAWGWEIDADTEYAIAMGQLPKTVQQVVRINVRAVALIAEVHAMRLEINGYGGASDEVFSTETIAVVNKPSATLNFAINDYIYWTLTPADDADIGHLLGVDSVMFKVKHEAAGNGDCATDAVFLCLEIEYV